MIFLLIFITGFILVTTISKHFTLLEKLAFAFPVGLGLSSIFMFLSDLLFHSITLGNLQILLLLCIAHLL